MVQKADGERILGYYLFMESDGRINIEKQDGGIRQRFSVLSAKEIKKYQIDPLGYYHEVKSKKRLGNNTARGITKRKAHERRTKKESR